MVHGKATSFAISAIEKFEQLMPEYQGFSCSNFSMAEMAKEVALPCTMPVIGAVFSATRTLACNKASDALVTCSKTFSLGIFALSPARTKMSVGEPNLDTCG